MMYTDTMSKKSSLFTPQNILLFLFYSLFFLTPLYFRFITEELFEFNKMILVYGFTTLISATWIIRMVLEKKVLLSRSKLDLPLMAFLGIQFLASIISLHPRTSFLGYYSRFHGGFLSTLSFVSLYYAFISNFDKKHITQLLIAFFSSASLVSIWGIFEHFGHSLSCVALNNTFDVSCWVQDVQNRVYASLGQPNWMAAFLIGIIPVALALVLTKTKRVGERMLLFSTLTLSLLALYYTKSRSGFLGLAAGLGAFLLIGTLFWQKTKKQSPITASQLKAAGLSLVIFLATALVTGTPYTPSLKELTSEPSPAAETDPQQVVNRLDIGGTDSGEIRKIVWQGAIDVWKRYPILGSGVETFAYSYYADRPVEHNTVSEWDFLYNKAHNELLNYLATTGLAGLLSYLAVWMTMAVLVIKMVLTTKKMETDHILVIGLTAGIGAMFVSNFFGFSTVTISLLMYAFLAMIALLTDSTWPSKTTSAKKHTPHTSQGLDGSQYMAITFISIVTIFALAKISSYWSADVHYARAKTLLKSGDYESGIAQMQTAIQKSPKEALFYDTFSVELANIAVALAEQQETTAAAQIAQSAIAMSDTAIQLNNAHLNFYKTRTRMFITLSQIEPQLLTKAQETLIAAIQRSPTDPKLYYNLGVVESSLGSVETGISYLEKAVELKPDYPSARLQLGKEYAENQRFAEAKQQFEFILANIDPQNVAAQQQLEQIATASAETE